MKVIKLTNLFILTLCSQIVFSQNNDIVRSFGLRMDKFFERSLDSTDVAKALKIQFKIPENYEFKRQVIHGTKDETREKDDLGYVHERYKQYYKGIKIEHSDIRAHYLNNLFVSANGEYIDAPNIDVSVILSKETAIQKAVAFINAKEYMWEDENNWMKSIDTSISLYPKSEIIICKNSIDIQDTMFYIAYKIDVFAKEPLRHDYVYVDAKTGNILATLPILINGIAQTRYSGSRTISTTYDQNKNQYLLKDYTRGGGIETYNVNNSWHETESMSHAVDFTDNDDNWTSVEYKNANKDDGALDAHWGAMMTYDYFKNVHGRNSFDNNNTVLRNYVHYGSNYDNAGWNQLYRHMIYGDGESCDVMTSLDIIAHEIGHGVCQYSVDSPNGLVYSGESGAINESLSDIWGACIENWATTNKQTWLIGEDIGCIIRNMFAPKEYGQPNTYGGINWWNPLDDWRDNGGVHKNSGIMNYWFYLLSIGGSGTNDLGNSYNVTGIGISKAEKIVYRAETVYMTANTNFFDARTHTIQAAIDLYGECSPEMINVANAWYAVGVGSSVQDNVTWDKSVYVAGDVTIQSGATLTITSQIKFMPNAKIIIQPGGKLIVNGGTLTSACDGLWQGISVLSKDANEGILELNNATIKDAVCAVRAGDLVFNGSFYECGTVQAVNSHFINNKQAVYFAPYSNGGWGLFNSTSYFTNCEFLLDNNAIRTGKAQVEIQGVQGVSFTNCTFTDSRTKNHITDFTNGIYANASSISVSDYQPPHIPIPSDFRKTFSGFDRAIAIQNAETYPSYISYCTFSNNNISIDSRLTRGLYVNDCHFSIPSIIYSPDYNLYGIYLEKSSGYNIDNNYFTGTGGIGICADNAGMGNHFIHYNTFKNLCIGALAKGVNGIGYVCPSQGLVFQCNGFNNNYEDIVVAANSDIKCIQSGAKITEATGNYFNNSSKNIYNEGYVFTYNHLATVHHTPSVYPSANKVKLSEKTEIGCVSSSMAGNIFEIGGYFLTAKMVYEAKEANYKIKGFNENPINWEDTLVQSIVSQLDMLGDFTVTVGGMPPSNPQEEQIAMFYELTNAKQQMDIACYAAVEFLANEAEFDINEYRTWLSRFNTIESDYALADSYIRFGEFTDAENILNAMPSKFPYLDITTHQNYLDYFAAAQDIDFLLHKDYTLSPSFFGEVIAHFKENKLLPSFLLDDLMECFESQEVIPSYAVEDLTNVFKTKTEFFPLWQQKATQYLIDTEGLTDSVINELFDNFLYSVDLPRYIIENKEFYPYWQDGFAQYLEAQGFGISEIDSLITDYQGEPFSPLLVDDLVNYFTVNFSSNYWKNVLFDYVSATKQVPDSLINNFVQFMGVGGEFPPHLLSELIANIDPIEFSPMLYSLTSLPGIAGESLNFLYNDTVCLIGKMEVSEVFLPNLLVYVKKSTSFPTILKDKLYHSFGIDLIPTYLINELVRLSVNDDRAGIKSHSLLEACGEVKANFENWKRTYEPYLNHCIALVYDSPMKKEESENSTSTQDEQTPEKPIVSIEKKGEITVKPNPTTGQLTISIDNGQLTMDNVEIYSVVGQKLNNYQLSTVNYQLIIDVSHLANGIYYLKIITTDGSQQVRKFVKE